MDGRIFVKPCEAAKFFGVCNRTLSRWKDSGQIAYKQKPSGQFIYAIPTKSTTDQKREKSKIIYVRVSSRKEMDDLKRQTHFLQTKFPNHKVIDDIGSGLNFKRRGLLNLLQLVIKGDVEEIVVSSKDRLCRFGYELVHWLCEQHNTKILVLQSSQETEEQQFVTDVLSIIQIYTCKWNGRRRYTTQGKKSKVTIEIQPEGNVETVE